MRNEWINWNWDPIPKYVSLIFNNRDGSRNNNNLLDPDNGGRLARVQVNHGSLSPLVSVALSFWGPTKVIPEVEVENQTEGEEKLNCESFCFDNLLQSFARFFGNHQIIFFLFSEINPAQLDRTVTVDWFFTLGEESFLIRDKSNNK